MCNGSDIRKVGRALGLTSAGLANALGLESGPGALGAYVAGGAPVPPRVARRLNGLQGPAPFHSGDGEGSFTFIDLFAGIGGIRMPFQQLGGRCVFSSEWDRFSQTTYRVNYGDVPAGDIRRVPASDIPDFDILLAGFPCQPFSLAGVSKKNSMGRPTGFADKTQGTLFFEVARIIAEKRPSAFLLENVKNLVSHDRGRTFKVIMQTLEDELGYHIHWRVLDSREWTCQHRERIYIVGFREDVPFDWSALVPVRTSRVLADVLEPDLPPAAIERYTLSDKLWSYLRAYRARHEAAGHGFGYTLTTPSMTTRTLSARYHKDGSEILVAQEGMNPRRLTPRECARLQGFPDSFIIPVSDTQAYRQFGNSVTVPVIRSVARLMLGALGHGLR